MSWGSQLSCPSLLLLLAGPSGLACTMRLAAACGAWSLLQQIAAALGPDDPSSTTTTSYDCSCLQVQRWACTGKEYVFIIGLASQATPRGCQHTRAGVGVKLTIKLLLAQCFDERTTPFLQYTFPCAECQPATALCRLAVPWCSMGLQLPFIWTFSATIS
jgi:hypothetical protein